MGDPDNGGNLFQKSSLPISLWIKRPLNDSFRINLESFRTSYSLNKQTIGKQLTIFELHYIQQTLTRQNILF